MDFTEATRVVFNRIQKIEPQIVTKIIGYLLLHHGEGEMIRLAFGPDNMIQNLVNQAKTELPHLAPKPSPAPGPISPSMNPKLPFSLRHFSSPTAVQASAAPYWDPQLDQYQNQASEFVPFPDQAKLMMLEESSDFCFLEEVLGDLSMRATGRSPNSGFPFKTCHYFSKGFCKHGNNCRYLHGHIQGESFGPHMSAFCDEEETFSPRSLERLEMEITEILKSRRGSPISIASLPMIYFEKYGKVLQADGYLTESQRHGKAGYSLTKLLARLKHSIQLIDRPHGQHSVILAEEAPQYIDARSERNDPGPIVSGSRQIYLTFPAESSFSEEDVASYFSTFGTVEDVRIPCQHRRMFGFVTFASAETVKMILSKGNPHFVCGARVLVKPYRERSKFFDRRYSEKVESPMFNPCHYLDSSSELSSSPRASEASGFIRKQLMEDHEQMLELERRRFMELQFPHKPLTTQRPYFSYCMSELKYPEDHSKFPSAERFNHLLDVLNNSPPRDDSPKPLASNFVDQESTHAGNLPESPYASQAITSSISTVT